MATEARDLDEGMTLTWKRLVCASSGVVYLETDGSLTLENETARELLGLSVPVGERHPVHMVMDMDREEAKLLQDIMHHPRQIHNGVATWTERGQIRHILVDVFPDPSANGQDSTGMVLVMKDLGNFMMLGQDMQHEDKIAAVGKVAAGVAHEIRNPLTTVRGFLQVMMSRFEKEQREEETAFSRMMVDELDKVESLVSELLLLSKPHQLVKHSCAFHDLLEGMKPWVEELCTERELQCHFDLAVVPMIQGDATLLRHVVEQLVENATEAMESGGVLSLHLYMRDGMIQLDVHDTGPGIPYYQMDKVFDAFFTTKDKGTGLGLPISERIIHDHGGHILVASKGFGTTFTVQLPISVGESPRV